MDNREKLLKIIYGSVRILWTYDRVKTGQSELKEDATRWKRVSQNWKNLRQGETEQIGVFPTVVSEP